MVGRERCYVCAFDYTAEQIGKTLESRIIILGETWLFPNLHLC